MKTNPIKSSTVVITGASSGTGKAKDVPKSDGNLFAPDYDRTYIHGGYS